MKVCHRRRVKRSNLIGWKIIVSPTIGPTSHQIRNQDVDHIRNRLMVINQGSPGGPIHRILLNRCLIFERKKPIENPISSNDVLNKDKARFQLISDWLWLKLKSDWSILWANWHRLNQAKFQIGENNHDTIGIVAFDQFGKSAAGTTTNGKVQDRECTIFSNVNDQAIKLNSKRYDS